MSRCGALVAALLLAACAQDESPVRAARDGPTNHAASTRVTEEGPVKATVSLSPAQPRLGDPLSLSLSVEAEPGVTVEMPAFGEALGRFSILDFTPRQQLAPDGTTLASQHYTLQAPMSGKQRIPPLRIEFLDQRPGRPAASGDGYRELLTEGLTVEIASVLPDGQVADVLRPARPPLPEQPHGFLMRYWLWLTVGVVVLAGFGWGTIVWQRQQRKRARITAYDRALRRLADLERRGLPSGAEIDGWYVELSYIVRRFIEDQYGVRAPELTTEEFLQEAHRSAELSRAHRSLLSAFLERCDRVKFAAYSPAQDESRDALVLARRFLGETRVVAETKPPLAV